MARRVPFALFGALSALGLLFVSWFAAFHVTFLERADIRILSGFADLHRPRVDPIADRIASLCDPQPYIYFAAVPVLVALVRRRPRLALASGAIIFGANLTTQLLKSVLAEPRPLVSGAHIAAASWPSGHATAAMSLALCVVLVSPARLRPLAAALGAAFAVAVSYSFLTLGWHYPSDVFGGFLVAVTWTLLGVAAISAFEPRGRPGGAEEARVRLSVGELLGPSAAVAAGGVALVGLVALARPHELFAYARVHTTFVVGAAAIGTLALVLGTGITLLSGVDERPGRRIARRAGREEP